MFLTPSFNVVGQANVDIISAQTIQRIDEKHGINNLEFSGTTPSK